MAIYRMEDAALVKVERTTFANQGVKERTDLQRLLKDQIDIISPDTLVVAEEFGEWEDSKRRIDLLGIDQSANLVVIELKRTEDGGHMELQALRYAAMISTLTFERLVKIYSRYLLDNGKTEDAKESLLSFLDWQEPDEEQFGQEVKIVLASGEFSKELTTAVMWLNDFGLDIRCVRMHPYLSNGQTLLDVQTVIPIPEVEDYQVRIREKRQRERESREGNRDLTKFDLRVHDQIFPEQSKRWMMYYLIRTLVDHGASITDIADAIPWRKSSLLLELDGSLDAKQVCDFLDANDDGGVHPKRKRYFTGDGEIFPLGQKTYVLTNQWGKRSLEAVDLLKAKYPEAEINVKPDKAV